jgi:hypothetical protein
MVDSKSTTHDQSHQAFDNWDEEVVRIIKASKRSQRRLAEWVPELTNVHLPVVASMDNLKRLRKEEHASKLKCEISRQLHALYDPVVSDKLSPRFEALLHRFDSTRH